MTVGSIHSLRLKLPALIVVVVVAVGLAFLSAAYVEVRRNLVMAARDRAFDASGQLAAALGQSTRQRMLELQKIADATPVSEFASGLRTDPDACRATLASVAGPGSQRVELWDGQGTLRCAFEAAQDAPIAFPHGTGPIPIGVGNLRAYGGVVFSQAAVAVRDRNADAASDLNPPVVGALVVLRPVVTNPTGDMLNRMMGTGAAVHVGNQNGTVWTNLSAAVAPPPINLARPGVAEYVDPQRERHFGALTPIPRTPWLVWVEFPEQAALAPAHAWARRMVVVAFAVVLIVGVIVSVLTSRITQPLAELTDASEAVAAGDYSRRVNVGRQDEIGRLGAAFNTMAAQVATSHAGLENRVQRRTNELDRFFALSLDLLSTADFNGYFLRVSPSWTDVLGWTADELTSQPYISFVHPDDLASTNAEAAKLAEGATTLSFENRYLAKDGSFHWLEWKCVPLPADGVIYAAARDVTDRKRAGAAVQQHVLELGAVNQELEAFSYSVSHDLRAPLRHVTGFAALLQQHAGASLDETGRRYLTTMVDAAHRMGQLIDNLLAFSRVGRTTMQTDRVSLSDLVADAQREVTEDAHDRRIDWEIAPLPDVEGDPSLLKLAFVNLLSNAVKYTKDRTPARIQVATNGHHPGEIVVFVRDNGVGFDMAYSNKLFGVFQRLHRQEEFDGTGIGLANVRRIVHRHGGRVWAESAVGEGATFYMSLPSGGFLT